MKAMKKLLSNKLAVVAALICCAILTPALSEFKSPEVSSASDVQSPSGSSASGVVVLDVALDPEGNITGIEVPRPIETLTPVAIAAVRNWKFTPARVHAVATSSDIRIAFVFRPRVIYAGMPVFEPLLNSGDPSARSLVGYHPPGIQTVAYPDYPINAANVGAVAIRARINSAGKSDQIEVLRAFEPFTAFALEAIKKWTFETARLEGRPTTSSIVIAFVYSPPAISY